MATIGATDAYYTDFVINPDYSLSFTLIPTRQGGLPSPQTVPAQDVQATIDFLLPFVTSHTYPSSGAMQPYQVMVLTIAEQKGLVTAAQLQSWYQDNNMPVGGMKGYTSFDYDPAGPAVPSALAMATTPSLLGVSTSSTATMNAVQQTIADIGGAVNSLPTLTAHQETIEKMYLAAFLRAPEKGGLDYWTGLLDSGKTMTQVGDTVFSLPIVKAIYSDAMTNTQFVTAIYQNVFGKAPDAPGLDYWLSKIDGGEHRGDLVMDMMGAGLGTPVGTPGRDYIVNRVDTVHYAVQSQVKANVEISVNTLLDMTSKVGADAAAIATYHNDIDADIATLVGTSTAPIQPVLG